MLSYKLSQLSCSRDLADLVRGRQSHACTSVVHDGKKVIVKPKSANALMSYKSKIPNAKSISLNGTEADTDRCLVIF